MNRLTTIALLTCLSLFLMPVGIQAQQLAALRIAP